MQYSVLKRKLTIQPHRKFKCIFLNEISQSPESLVVHWLGLCTSKAGAQVQSLVMELVSHKPHSPAGAEAAAASL